MRTGKPRVALFGNGVLGGSYSGQGIPVLNDLFERLSEHYDIVYYSFLRISTENVPKSIKIRTRQITSLKLPGRLKFLFLLIRALLDHAKNPYGLIFSVSDYPSGFFSILMGMITRRKVAIQFIAFEAVWHDNIGVRKTSNWSRKLTAFVCNRAHVLIAVADYQKKLILSGMHKPRPIEVLPLRIESQKFIYRERFLSYPIQFIHVAYYSQLKDQNTMFKAFSIIANEIDCRLTVVGDGFDIPVVKNLLFDLNIQNKVSCIGFVSQADLPAYYDRAHVLFHTAKFETGCAVIQEAMASGVAVCGTDVGLLNDIGDEYAVIVPVGDEKKLAHEVLRLVRDPSKYNRITHRAYQWINQYNGHWSYNNYLQFLNKFLSGLVIKHDNM